MKIISFFSIALSLLLLCACGGTEKNADESANAIKSESADESMTSQAGESSDVAYETVYDEAIVTNDCEIECKVLINTENMTDTKIVIDDQNITISKETVLAYSDVGYVHCETFSEDLTGDGIQELILILHGGASGAVDAVHVFTLSYDSWKEIPISLDYLNNEAILKEHSNRLDKVVDDVTYRKIEVKSNCIIIHYILYSETDEDSIGSIDQVMKYEDASQTFVMGDSSFVSK